MGSVGETACPAGKYCATPSQEEECPAGSYCPKGSTAPERCPAGSYCEAGSASATRCPPGTANSKAGQSSPAACTPCSGGSFASTAGSARCTQCSAGSYCPSSSAHKTVQVTSDGSYEKPDCSWDNTCSWDDQSQARCAKQLCIRAGYLGGSFVSATNNPCTTHIPIDRTGTVHAWSIDNQNYQDAPFNDIAEVTAACESSDQSSSGATHQ